MKTADLISALAADSRPVEPAPVMGLLAAASLLGAFATGLVLAAWLGLRPLGPAVHTGPFWMKAAYTLALGLAGFLLACRLARPGSRPGRLPMIALLAMLVMLGLSVLELSRAPPGSMRSILMGHTAAVCSLRILVLSVPVYFGAIFALRRLAPTRLALTGAAAGMLAGGLGASVYGLYCDESAATFVVMWYTLGIAASAAVGALIGSRLLRW
jgi:hypothetical protein